MERSETPRCQGLRISEGNQQVNGCYVEPRGGTNPDWEASVLPLNYARDFNDLSFFR